MTNITLSVPEDLKHSMESFSEINWSAVAREAFGEKVKELNFIREFKKNSNITEKDAIRLGKELNRRLARRR